MKRNPATKNPRERGVALVIVLAFVVLLTGLVVAYFARTITDRQLSDNSYSQAAADQLARSALSIITGDLKQELAASGSTSTIGGTTINTYPEVMPVRSGVKKSGTSVTSTYSVAPLLRISTTTGTTGAIDQLASSALSTGTSANGRSITPARWNQSYLMPRANPLVTTIDSTPGTAYFNSSTTSPVNDPYWVYITGAGPANPQPTSPTPGVVGRYAYMVYDESSLLDINSAGYPSTTWTSALATTGTGPWVTSGTTSALYSGKGSLAFADLTVPALTGAPSTAGLSGSTANAIVGWRNFATLNNISGGMTGSFPSFIPSTAGANGFYTAITTNTTGFLSVSGSTTNTGLSDQVFLTRQQLISLLTVGIGKSTGSSLATMQYILQYLGTFSRAVSAPSWAPEANASNLPNPVGNFYGSGNPSATGANSGIGTTGTLSGISSYAYKDNAESTGAINRDLANVRFSTTTAVTHYSDAGTTTTYSANIGDPYVQHRFSLARIKWLTHTGPASGMTQAVKDCFGLQWGADAFGSPCWMYIHGSVPNQSTPLTSATGGTSLAVGSYNTILTLDAAAKLGREPDFFELLKAAILAGSLGLSPGADYYNYNDYNQQASHYSQYTEGVGGYAFDTTMDLPDEQIIQIGVNIIDQYHSDGYPTAIFFQGPHEDCTAAPEYGPLNVLYGIKNLPYLNKLYGVFWETAGVSGTTNGFNAWLQPELWNPFQAAVLPAAAKWPSSFSLQAYGVVQLSFGGASALNSSSYDPQIPLWDYDTTYQNESTIYYKDAPITTGTYVSTFANPLLVSSSNQDTSTGSVTTPINIAPAPNQAESSSTYNVMYTQYTGPSNYNQFMAIHAGSSPFGIVPNNGQYSGGSGLGYGTAPDNTRLWVADNGEAYNGLKPDGTPNILNDGQLDYSVSSRPPPDNNAGAKTVGPGVTFCLKYWDGTQWLPYSYMSRVVLGESGFVNPSGTWTTGSPGPPTAADAIWGYPNVGNAPIMHADPRSDRFSVSTLDGSHYHWTPEDTTWEWAGPPPPKALGNNGPVGIGQYNAPAPCPGPFYYDYQGYDGFNSTLGVPDWGDGSGTGLFYGAWAQNLPMNYNGTAGVNDAFYADPDGIVRPGNDCCWNSTNASAWTSTLGDGLSQLANGYSTITGTGTQSSHTMGRRPLILNRPFRSVGELGYASRDLPFKTLDFFTAYSADAGLLDVFSVSDEPAVIAGQINPNNASVPVLQAILSGASKQEAVASSGSPYNMSVNGELATTATNGLPTAITSYLTQIENQSGSGNQAIIGNRSDLVTKLGVQCSAGLVQISSTASPLLNGFGASPTNKTADQADKAYLEAPIRALADVTNTRTWNLMIDVIAQSGSFVPNAGTGSAALNSSFVVKGERRYWLHVAIDRFTGKVVDEQLEPVYD